VLVIDLSGLFVIVYDPNSNVDCRLLWVWDLPWCIRGDYNATFFPCEKFGEADFSLAMEEVLHFIFEQGLMNFPV
jgi:hypothetical protein